MIIYRKSGVSRGIVIASALLYASGFVICGQAPGQVSPHTSTYSFSPIIERISPAVVNIYAHKIIRSRGPRLLPDSSALWRLFRDSLLFGYGRERIQNALGSGVIVRPEGVVVTNHHVIEAAEGIGVVLADGRIFEARVLLSDKRTDLAVLNIEVGGETLPFVELGDSDRIKVGDPILAVGNPFGLEQTVTSGIISALARTGVGITDLRFFIQTDASINPGNSGGPLIAIDGSLVGINTAIYSTSIGAQGLSFAIPSNMVGTVVLAAIQNKPLVRAWTGISGRSIPPQLAGLLGLSRPRGVLVTNVYKGSPAEEAGLRRGDVILQVGDFPVNDPQALRYRIATRMIGERVQLTVQRRGTSVQVPVQLEPPPDEPTPDERQLSNLSPLSGATVVSLSPAFAEDHGLDSGISGVAVLDVRPGSAAERVGLRAGDIIRAIDNQPITTVQEVEQLRSRAFKGWSLILTRRGQEISIQGG